MTIYSIVTCALSSTSSIGFSSLDSEDSSLFNSADGLLSVQLFLLVIGEFVKADMEKLATELDCIPADADVTFILPVGMLVSPGLELLQLDNRPPTDRLVGDSSLEMPRDCAKFWWYKSDRN